MSTVNTQRSSDLEATHVVILDLPENEIKYLPTLLLSLIGQSYGKILLIAGQSLESTISSFKVGQFGSVCQTVYLPMECYRKNAVERASRIGVPYCILVDHAVLYSTEFLQKSNETIRKNRFEILSHLIQTRIEGRPLPSSINAQAAILYEERREEEAAVFDRFWFNKIIETSLLKGIMDRCSDDTEALMAAYTTSFIGFSSSGCVTYFSDDQVSIPSSLTKGQTDFISDLNNYPVLSRLDDRRFDRGLPFQMRKLLVYPNKTIAEKLQRKIIGLCKRLSMKDRILFYSIRSDNELSGNIKALYDKTEGNKLFFAHKTPHWILVRLYSIWLISTSRLIVVDDYVSYLRYFPLKKGQRVIQLWHASGAFKCFGRRGTETTARIDSATHAQYSLVCTSGESVRTIYADAFNLSIDRVSALGVPSTDCFFDNDYKILIREKIYHAHPELNNKKIILYAPTFRDGDGIDRKRYQSPLHFEHLSTSLPENVVFVICPHPVMRSAILNKALSNVFEVRDFSTTEMMFISDLLITDYSSVIFEYALLGKPMAFFCYDLDSYPRSFYLRYPDDLPGDVLKTQCELESYLRSPDVFNSNERAAEFASKYMDGCDGRSAERIASVIQAYMNGIS